MSLTPYKRVDLDQLPEQEADSTVAINQEAEPAVPQNRVRVWVIVLALVLCVVQAGAQLWIKNAPNPAILTTTLIPVFAFGVLVALLLIVNPILALTGGKNRSRRLNRIEIISLFCALFATAGFSAWGPASHLVPLMVTPWNPELNTPQQGWSEHITHPESPLLNPRLFIQDERAIQQYREGVRIVAPLQDAPLGERVEYWVAVFRSVPWGIWIPPLSLWLIFVFACYGLFYSLAYVVLRYWSDREKLTFPLAQLPSALIQRDRDGGLVPPIFKNAMFWAGFAVSGGILAWNAAATVGWIPNDLKISLGLGHVPFEELSKDTILDGIGGYFRALFIFTAIGLAFLLPTHISSSIWGYSLFGHLLLLIAIWIGFGESHTDFPFQGGKANFITAQGGGALLAVAAISLFRCLMEYWRLARNKPLADAVRLTYPVLWMALCTAIIIVWLLWNKVSLVFAFGFVLFIALSTIGLMRIVAESSVYWLGNSFGLTHLYHLLGIGKIVPGTLLAPLLPVYSLFFAGIETLVAPSLLNAAKIQKDSGRAKRAFHITILLAIVVSVVFSIGFAIYLAYMKGAQQLHGWFQDAAPRTTMTNIVNIIRDESTGFSWTTVWFCVGVVWLALSLRLRRSFFWFPHPIGYVLLFSGVMRALWFSFMVGWVAKAITVRYGGKRSFDMVKVFFIGLILGELLSVFFWTITGLFLDTSPGIDMHRYGP